MKAAGPVRRIVAALAALPALAFIVGAAARFHKLLGPILLVGALSPWPIHPSPEAWICWKESQVNSEARRAWSEQAASFLQRNYKGGGIAASFGDLTGVFRRAGIPLREPRRDRSWTMVWPAVVGVRLRPVGLGPADGGERHNQSSHHERAFSDSHAHGRDQFVARQRRNLHDTVVALRC